MSGIVAGIACDRSRKCSDLYADQVQKDTPLLYAACICTNNILCVYMHTIEKSQTFVHSMLLGHDITGTKNYAHTKVCIKKSSILYMPMTS